MLQMEIEAALYRLLTLGLPITQILNNDANNIKLFLRRIFIIGGPRREEH